MRVKAWFSAREAAELAGFKTVHMANHLARAGLLTPSIRSLPGRGRRRQYSFRDIVLMRALSRLLAQRLPVVNLKTAQKEFARIHGDADDFAIQAKFLTTDGSNVYYKAHDHECIELTRSGQLAFAFMLDIEQVADEIRDQARTVFQERISRRRRGATK